MPSVLSKNFLASKILGKEWSFGYNCYEVGHTWTPSCTHAALEVSTAAAVRVIPLYAALYIFSQLAVQRRTDLEASWDTTKSVIRSSCFIFFHAYNGSVMGCALRRGFGRFYYRVLVCAPAMLSSYLALVIEKPARRQALAFYMLNMASEIVYRMAVAKHYFKPMPHGETMLFALSMAAWYYLLKKHGFGHDPISGAVKALIGRDEAKSRARPASIEQQQSNLKQQINGQQRTLMNNDNDKMGKFSLAFQRLGACLVTGGRHPSCPHKAYSTCFEYVLYPVPGRLLLGYLIGIGLRLASRPMQLFSQPLLVMRQTITAGSSVRFGLFLATLVAAGRATSCTLRHKYQADNDWQAALAGFVAGLAMIWSPKASISMYVMWKAVEQYYLLVASRQGLIKHWHNVIVSTIYACSAATILYAFALEPKFVRPSYMKFLDRLSEHRLHQLNRMVLDVFGTGSSIGYEDYFPDLDPKHMSNQFKELVFNWMIQPYE